MCLKLLKVKLLSRWVYTAFADMHG